MKRLLATIFIITFVSIETYGHILPSYDPVDFCLWPFKLTYNFIADSLFCRGVKAKVNNSTALCFETAQYNKNGTIMHGGLKKYGRLQTKEYSVALCLSVDIYGNGFIRHAELCSRGGESYLNYSGNKLFLEGETYFYDDGKIKRSNVKETAVVSIKGTVFEYPQIEIKKDRDIYLFQNGIIKSCSIQNGQAYLNINKKLQLVKDINSIVFYETGEVFSIMFSRNSLERINYLNAEIARNNPNREKILNGFLIFNNYEKNIIEGYSIHHYDLLKNNIRILSHDEGENVYNQNGSSEFDYTGNFPYCWVRHSKSIEGNIKSIMFIDNVRIRVNDKEYLCKAYEWTELL